MNKLRMEPPDMTAQNIDRIAALFPNCITEMLDEEHSTPEKKVYKRAVNFAVSYTHLTLPTKLEV